MPATKESDVARGSRIPKGREKRESMRSCRICSALHWAYFSASASSPVLAMAILMEAEKRMDVDVEHVQG